MKTIFDEQNVAELKCNYTIKDYTMVGRKYKVVGLYLNSGAWDNNYKGYLLIVEYREGHTDYFMPKRFDGGENLVDNYLKNLCE